MDESNFNTLTDSERDQMRKELSSYINECRLDSEGNPLVQIPSNFNQVARAMNRDDLFSLEEKPWSKYLLQSSLTADNIFSDSDSCTRYKEVAEDSGPDGKIQKGLAEIHMLDRQLQQAAEKDKAVVSRLKINSDRTFLTKYASEQSPSTQLSTRTDLNSARANNTDTEPLIDDQTNLSPKAAASNVLIPRQKRYVLSAEEETRLQSILEADDDQMNDDYFKELMEYKAKSEDLNSHLAEYDRLNRLVVDIKGLEDAVKESNNKPEQDGKKDYIAEQRQERQQKEAMRRLDKQLLDCTSQVASYLYYYVMISCSLLVLHNIQRMDLDGLLGLDTDRFVSLHDHMYMDRLGCVMCRGEGPLLVDEVPLYPEVR